MFIAMRKDSEDLSARLWMFVVEGVLGSPDMPRTKQ